MKSSHLLWVAVLLGLTSCSSEDAPPLPLPTASSCEDTLTAVETLRWKRVGPFIADLGRALELDQASVCTELGELNCEQLYRLPLGGSDPFGAAIYQAPKAPMNTTSALTERVTLAACARRVSLDQAGAPVVFRHVDLGAGALSAGAAGVEAQVDELYRRLLSRDPTAEERSAVATLAEGVSGSDFAKLACFSIGTTTEFLFF